MMKSRYRTKTLSFPRVDHSQPLRKQRNTGALSYPVHSSHMNSYLGPRNLEQLHKALRREPLPPQRDLLQARREPFPPRPVVPLLARQPPAPPRRFPARIFQSGRQPAAQGPANGPAHVQQRQAPIQQPQAPVQQPQAPAPATAPAQQMQQQNIQAAPLNQEQWLQRVRGQEVEPRNGAVRTAVLSLINQRDVINAQLKGLYEEFGREGR
ncbi:hypothetical protein CPB85DRAFT_1292528 [Mucidula mucida]|nr:hypothetical protein CPB85DRAFT_1292528 [Mucidula mucida]